MQSSWSTHQLTCLIPVMVIDEILDLKITSINSHLNFKKINNFFTLSQFCLHLSIEDFLFLSICESLFEMI